MDQTGGQRTDRTPLRLRLWLIEGCHFAWPKTKIALQIECLAGGACNPKIIYDIKSRDSKRCLSQTKGKDKGSAAACVFLCRGMCIPIQIPSFCGIHSTGNYIKNLALALRFCARFDYQPLHLHSHFHFHFQGPKPPGSISFFFVSHSCILSRSVEIFAHLAACIYHLRIISSRLNGIIYLPPFAEWELGTFPSWTAAAVSRIPRTPQLTPARVQKVLH